MSSSELTASVASARFHLNAATELGLDASEALRLAELSWADLEDPDRRLPLANVGRVVAWVSGNCPEPSYGLWLGRNFHPAKLSLVGYVMLNARTVGDALARFEKYKRVVGDGFTVETEPAGPAQHLFALNKLNLGGLARVVQEWHQAATVTCMRVLSGQDVRPIRACFSHPEPEWRSEYDDLFQCPLEFESDRTALLLRQRDLDLRVRHADSLLEGHFLRLAEAVLGRLDGNASMSRRVSETLLEWLPQGEPRVADVARHLAVSVRTLQAALKAEGTSYRSLLSDLRLRLSRGHLKDARVSIAEVSFLVGFSEPSAFHRAFKRWAGQTPQAYRASLAD